MLQHHPSLLSYASSSNTPTTHIYSYIYLYKPGSCNKRSGFLCKRLGAGMLCALIPAHTESVQGAYHKHRHAHA